MGKLGLKQTEKEIREAYIFLREKNMSVPSETLQFMLDASLEKLQSQSTKPNVSQQRELLKDFAEWQKDNWKKVYLYSEEFMINEFLETNCNK